ncbi:MAG: alpha/beta hydrolase [Burkholderiales bacterium]|nr:alpha/beta hydrolase [Burkholderiales bacterium]
MLNYSIHNELSPNPIWFVFVHGFTGSLEAWNIVKDILSAKVNNPILLIDNLGSGRSPQPNGGYTTDMMADSIIEVMEKLAIKQIYLVGHSLGGAIAQKIALKKQQSIAHLFVVSSFLKLNKVAQYFLQSRYELQKANVDRRLIALSAIASIFGQKFLLDNNNVEFAIQRVIDNPQQLPGIYGQLHACLNHDTEESIVQLKCDTTIITGKEDILIHPTHSLLIKQKLPHAKLYQIADAGHVLPLEAPHQLVEVIIELINQM